jgi:predicted ArsR family transcriptional regulator
MENLIILYFAYLAIGTVGQGRVSILDVARWMRTTKPTVKKRLDTLVEKEYLECKIRYSNGKPYQWLYSLTPSGQEYLDSVHQEAYYAYRIHVAKTIEAIKASKKQAETLPPTNKQIAAEKAGQKRMF